MMKRILSLVLALLTLATPVCAMGEASRLDVTMTVNEEIASGIFLGAGHFKGADNEAELCAAMAKLLNGYGLSFMMQDDAMSLALRLAGKELTDLSFLWGGDEMILTSTQMNGSGISIPMDEAELDIELIISELDWSELLGDMLLAVLPVLGEVEHASARGSFSGDAFTDGVYCETFIFDDALVARFLDAMMTDALREAIIAQGEQLGVDAQSYLDSFDQKNAQVLQDNTHRYILRLVSDAEYDPIGLSATVLQGESQLCTLSVGFKGDSVHIVAGFPVENVNYWHSHAITFETATDDQGAETLTVTGDLLEFTADRSHAFTYALYSTTDLRMNAEWTLETMFQANAVSYKFNGTMQIGQDTPATGISATGLYLSGKRFHGTLAYTLDSTEYMNLKVNWAPCDPMEATGAELTVCSLESEDTAQLEQIATEYVYSLALQLMKVIPPELLMVIQ